jgi:hypothetical protein
MRDRLIGLPVDDAILILKEEHKQRVDGYTTHLSYGGKGDPAEEVSLDALEMAISALEQTKWVSVKDRLPEDIDTYLVVVKYKYDFEKDFNYATDVATYNPYENAYIDDCWCTFNDWDEGQQYLHITHWMPLPPAPKGE